MSEQVEDRVGFDAEVTDDVFVGSATMAGAAGVIQTDIWIGPVEQWQRNPASLAADWFSILRCGIVTAFRTTAAL
ncbi:MAG: hypothetical protein KGL39_27360 [Patescibacteria group bacterium]|nr:hypothetical protein [Patescibacteria group bacterium]